MILIVFFPQYYITYFFLFPVDSVQIAKNQYNETKKSIKCVKFFRSLNINDMWKLYRNKNLNVIW